MRIIVSSGPSDLSLEMIHACFQTTSYFHFAPVEVLKSKSQQVCTRLWQTWKHTGCLSSHLNTVRNVELKQSVDYLSTNHLGIFFVVASEMWRFPAFDTERIWDSACWSDERKFEVRIGLELRVRIICHIIVLINCLTSKVIPLYC